MIAPKIVLSGGPCGGKTASLNFLRTELEKIGFDVFIVNEAAKSVMDEGFDRSKSTYEFQRAIAIKQLEKEAELEHASKHSKRPVIICDRGLMDSRVYLNDEDFDRIKRFLNMSEVELRDRYDAVFHMDSTSNSQNAKYKTECTRIESRDEALRLNERSLRAWCGNPHYRFIPVCNTLKDKQELLIKEIKHFLGVPKPLEIERKYLIRYPDTDFLLKLACSKVEIVQSYMIDENGRFRLRKRGDKSGCIYIKTEKRKISDTVREETEERLTRQEYEKLLNTNLLTGTISKDRYCLMYGGVYYEIDVFPFWQRQAYLEVELSDENEQVSIPDFLQVIEEVTHKPEYKNVALCHKIPKE